MKKIWWKEAVVYQIYPRSFKDSNGDGIGDLQGIISKLDYLKDLGINIIWICPFYKSPNDDNGYDISDYRDIHPDFGTMKDFEELLDETHKRGMKLIADLVINHTSDEHPWFIESRSSKNNPKRDWYIWRKGKNGNEPNNWESIFKGSAWEYDKKTDEYYLHLFTKKQPDLNWENPEMRHNLYDMINWWIDKGIDGFRVDATSHIKKEQTFSDMPNPDNEKYVDAFDKFSNCEGIYDHLQELSRETFKKHDIMTVAEANKVESDSPLLDKWIGEENGAFNMLFQFEHVALWTEKLEEGESVVVRFKKALSSWQNNLYNKGWNALFIENHDLSRVISTFGNDKELRNECAKSFALMYFMQQGTPYIYQGQELGMTNVRFKDINTYDDVKTINIYKELIEKGFSEEKALEIVGWISRDNARTPMQWSSEANGGFSDTEPWIPVNENYKTINAENEIKDENSILNFYKRLIHIRKSDETFIYGKYELILEDDVRIYAYLRKSSDAQYIIICNLTEKEALYSYENIKLDYEKLIISNYSIKYHEPLTEFKMKPWECRLYKI